jgi:hypothetical protein
MGGTGTTATPFFFLLWSREINPDHRRHMSQYYRRIVLHAIQGHIKSFMNREYIEKVCSGEGVPSQEFEKILDELEDENLIRVTSDKHGNWFIFREGEE